MSTQKIIATVLFLSLVSTAWAQQNPSQPATRPAQSMSAEQMLNRLLSPRSGEGQPLQPGAASGSAVDVTTGTAAVAPNAPSLSVLREGTFLVDRAGRLTRSADGQNVEFTFEADGKTMADPPVIILPNQKLMLMEDAVKASTRDLHFRITGLVTEYRGRNYVLLEKVVVSPETEQPLR